jgi:hypothetical protein
MSSDAKPGNIKISSDDGWDEFLIALAEIHGHSLSKMSLRLYRAATSDLTFEQLTTGANWLLRNAKFFPNPPECVEACTGIPVASLASREASEDEVEEARLWSWLVRWWSWLINGNHYEITVAPYSDHSVIRRFTARSLAHGIAALRLGSAQERLYLAVEKPELKPPNNTFQLAADKRIVEVARALTRVAIDLSEAIRKNDPADIAAHEAKVAFLQAELLVCKQDRAEAPARDAAETKAAREAALERWEQDLKKAEAKRLAHKDDLLYCRLHGKMVPPMPPVLEKILIQLGVSVGTGLEQFEKFYKSPDPYFRTKFRKSAMTALRATRQVSSSTKPASRQLTGAVQSDDAPLDFIGIIQINCDESTEYYSVELLREEQAAGIPITDQDIADQVVFVAMIDELWREPYELSPPPIPPKQLPSVDPHPGGIPGLTTHSHEEIMADIRRIEAEKAKNAPTVDEILRYEEDNAAWALKTAAFVRSMEKDRAASIEREQQAALQQARGGIPGLTTPSREETLAGALKIRAEKDKNAPTAEDS